MRKEQLTPPATSALGLTEAKAYANIFSNADDARLTPFLQNSIDYVESRTGRALINQTFKITYEDYRMRDRTPLGTLNVSSITSVTTYNRSNVATLHDPSTYRLSGSKDMDIILEDSFVRGSLRKYDALEIVVVAGYGTGKTDIPSNLITAMNMTFAHLCYDIGVISVGGLSEIPSQRKTLMFPHTSVRTWIA